MNRRALLIPLLLLAAFLTWRHFNPPLDDREIILAETEAIRKAAQNGDAGGILRRLSDDFRFEGASKSEIRTQLVGFFWQHGDLKLDFAGVDAKVEDDTAASEGAYTVRWKSSAGSTEEAKSGRFKAEWRKIEGNWKIIKVSGVDNIGL